MNKRYLPLVLSAVVALCTTGLSGCASQISALAPVSGDDVAAVRTAATDVLLKNQISILEAPVCTKSKTEITCTGRTAEETDISVTSPLDGTMIITVESKQLFSGSVQEVLDEEAGITP